MCPLLSTFSCWGIVGTGLRHTLPCQPLRRRPTIKHAAWSQMPFVPVGQLASCWLWVSLERMMIASSWYGWCCGIVAWPWRREWMILMEMPEMEINLEDSWKILGSTWSAMTSSAFTCNSIDMIQKIWPFIAVLNCSRQSLTYWGIKLFKTCKIALFLVVLLFTSSSPSGGKNPLTKLESGDKNN